MIIVSVCCSVWSKFKSFCFKAPPTETPSTETPPTEEVLSVSVCRALQAVLSCCAESFYVCMRVSGEFWNWRITLKGKDH